MRLGLILSEVGQGFRRNLSMVVSVVLVTFISLTFFGAAILLQTQISQTKGYWYDRAQVAVYLCSRVRHRAPLQRRPRRPTRRRPTSRPSSRATPSSPYIKKVEFEDRDQAYQNFLDQFEGTTAAELVTPDILNESFRVNLIDPTRPRSSSIRSPACRACKSVDRPARSARADLRDHERRHLHRDRHRRPHARSRPCC